MAANKAGLRLTLDDGTDLADRIDPRLLELTLVEKRGGEADELVAHAPQPRRPARRA
jgi:phage protein D